MPTPLPIAVLATALSADPRQAAPRARALGFAGLQFDALAPAFDLTQLSQSGRREFRHVLSAHDQQGVALRVDLGARGLSPSADIDKVLARLDAVLEAAAGVAPNAPLLCLDLGPLPEPPEATAPRPKIAPDQAGLILLPTAPAAPEPQPAPARPRDVAFEAHVDAALAELGARADRYSVTVALRSELASFAALERALRASRCPWFGIDLDPVAILRDRWPADEVFSRLGPALRHVRARDALAGHDRRTKPAPLGKGSTDWGQLLALLDEAAYHGWLTVDPLELPDRPAAAAAALEHLKRATAA